MHRHHVASIRTLLRLTVAVAMLAQSTPTHFHAPGIDRGDAASHAGLELTSDSAHEEHSSAPDFDRTVCGLCRTAQNPGFTRSPLDVADFDLRRALRHTDGVERPRAPLRDRPNPPRAPPADAWIS